MSGPSLPPEFSWLRASYRPSDQEVAAFAHLIAQREGCPTEASGLRLFDEAELQLWTWRNEKPKRKPVTKPRAASKVRGVSKRAA